MAGFVLFSSTLCRSRISSSCLMNCGQTLNSGGGRFDCLYLGERKRERREGEREREREKERKREKEGMSEWVVCVWGASCWGKVRLLWDVYFHTPLGANELINIPSQLQPSPAHACGHCPPTSLHQPPQHPCVGVTRELVANHIAWCHKKASWWYNIPCVLLCLIHKNHITGPEQN